MSFREKSAWITFVLVLAVFALWLTNVIRVEFFGLRHGNPMLFAIGLLTIFIVAEIVLHVAIALQSPAEARAPKDERERLIDLKASRVGFYVLAAGAWLSVGSMHIRFNTLFVAQNVMGALFIAELVKLATQIVLYRRDA